MRRWLLSGSSAALLALALVLPVRAGAVSVLLGPSDLSPDDPFAICDSLSPEFCTAKTFIPTALPEPGARLVSPADGTITSWRVRGAPPGKLRLRIVEATGGGSFAGVDSTGVAKVSDGSDNKIAATIGVGQQLGINLENTFPQGTSSLLGIADLPGAAWSAYGTGLADRSTAAPTSTAAGSAPAFNATVELFRPVLFNLTSTSGPAGGGDIVVINGTHLAVATAVTFGGVPATIVRAGNNQIMVVAPAHPPGPARVLVHTAGGASQNSVANVYTYDPAPPLLDLTGPTLARVKVSPRRSPRGRAPVVSFSSSEAGSAELRLLRRKRGESGPFRLLGRPFAQPVQPGVNRFRLSAELVGSRLRTGRYRLAVAVSDGFGNRSNRARVPFRVVVPEKGGGR